MNVAIISGTLVAHAIAKGTETRVLLFTVQTRNGTGADNVSFAPCALFNPPAELEQRLVTQGKGLRVELQGRVHCSCYQAGNQPRFNTEVIVFSKSFVVLD